VLYTIEPMEMDDIPEVMAVERECFPTPWPASAYRRELRDRATARYIVARYHGTALEDPSGRVPEPRRSFFTIRIPLFGKPVQAVPNPKPPIVGFAGLWLMLDEAHITTIGVKVSHRGRGVGELLLLGLFDAALEMGAALMTLEVRVSNSVAQKLYEKYGFERVGIRKRYYSDNGEDAYIMTVTDIQSPYYRKLLERYRTQLQERHRALEEAEEQAVQKPNADPGHRD
jgi:ribosomal-protein-alanine N-acetyltransferase